MFPSRLALAKSYAVFKTYKAFQSIEETVMVALDLEDAHDREQYTTLLTIKSETGIEVRIIQWTPDALFSRTIALKCRTQTSRPVQILPGLPQRSSVLFNIYI